MTFLVVFLLGCTTPTLSSVEPWRAAPGERVQVAGEHFTPRVQVYLAKDGQPRAALEQVELAGPTRLSAVLPEEEPGIYDLVVERRGRAGRLPSALELLPEVDETPCSDEFTANTELSIMREEVVVDRFYRNGERQTVRLGLEEIARVEYELVDDGIRQCSVIYLRTTENKRVVFNDDTKVDLRERARKIARDMGKELEVTRLDAAAMGEGVDDD
ncbi:MAG: hypothetical protein JRJ84_11475 [Deltaproteobacteria bacterium]|nr:hypothetical protein [Deltaproteobacteria bacterium]